MTVCVAAMCRRPYGPNDIGSAVITASDRMMTAENFEYEPPMRKFGELTRNAVVLVAGDMTVHSEALQETSRRLRSNETTSVRAVAEIYATCLREVVAHRAAVEYLGPYGISMNDFIERQPALADSFVARVQQNLSTHRIDVEALVVGHDQIAQIYVIDDRGLVFCQNDIGFAAIGIGYAQAKAQFMLADYVNVWPYPRVLTLTHWPKDRRR